jgi:GH35 family endo-1,4-beta-xylanase
MDYRDFRTAEAVLTLKGADGEPLAGTEVEIGQTSHAFLFGSNAFDVLEALKPDNPGRELAEEKVGLMARLFNAATLPFYWGLYEPRRGEPMRDALAAAACRCRELGLRPKGHPLCWHTLAPDWLLPLDDDEILALQQERVDREVGGFKGLIDDWDVVNEAVIMPIFEKYDSGPRRLCRKLGRIELIRRLFARARSANPSAFLLINDFDMSAAYDILIEGCLEAGIRIDAIGLQSHMHQGWWGVEKTERILERFERFGLPIHFTETTIISGDLMPPHIVDLNDWQVDDWPSTPEGEARQAEEVAAHYRTLFSHRLVQGIVWWDFADGKWLKAPSGLVRRDGSPKPAYRVLEGLIKGEWWTKPARFRTDADGRLRYRAFLGQHRASARGAVASFSMEKDGSYDIELTLRA